MQSIENHDTSKPLVLTFKQRDVLEVLQSEQTEEYPLSDWYTGALYALDNHYNPDRVAQAAHSLRELLEKLPRVVHRSETPGSGHDFAGMRRSIHKRILKDIERYSEGWKDEQINAHLDKTLRKVMDYFERNQHPTRREQIQQAVATIDPMVNSLDTEIQEAKRNQYYHLWDQLEGFAHHKSDPDIAEFNKCLEELENIVYDLFAPATEQDQKEILAILSLPDTSESDVKDMFSLIERSGANFVFFFKQVSENANATWLPYLEKRGYFAHLPNVQLIDDSVIFPFWWPIYYLGKISNQAPDEIIEIVQNLPPVNNPLVYDGILEVALQLHGDQSAKLKSKILESVSIEYQSRTHRYADLLAHWVKENQISAALELSRILVAFAPDPQSKEKRQRRKENPMDLGTTLYPLPRIKNPWEYSKIMTDGVYSLAESEPYEVARFLIYTVSNMYRMQMHQDIPDKEQDFSDIWFPRLQHGPDKSYDNPDKTLVYGLTFACEKVFEKSQEGITDLDKLLRKQEWKVFERLRQHLYAQYPNEETKEWIRELILECEDYDQSQHSYEFQQMIRASCDHFQEELLTREELTRIFDTILSGPSKEDYQGTMGERFTEERFLKRQHYFHRRQFVPFASVLFGEYKAYFQKLEKEADDPISDEDYPPFLPKSGWVSNRSPYSPQELANLTDERLLERINEWESDDERYREDEFVEINIEAFANVFQTVFMESIIPDTNRLRFWMQNRENIERPIYVRMIIYAMQAHVKKKNFDQLNEWLTFCEWVFSHSDKMHEGDYRRGDESREKPDWSSTRQAASDFIRTCLEKNVEVPITARGQLAALLEMLCTQFDWHLDGENQGNLYQYGPLTKGINSTRGRALEDLIEFGLWLRRYNSSCEVPELTTILEKRFVQENGVPPLTLPEYALLGANYPLIVYLNEAWAIKHKSDFFPQNTLPKWMAAFESLVGYSGPSSATFQILQEDFNFAVQHLYDFKNRKPLGKEPIDIFGDHLFTYYMSDLYPLRGDESLLERYYQQTNNDPKHWGKLFGDIGHRLSKGGKDLDQNLKEKIIKFCEWRLEQKESTELKHFTFWLQAECLDVEWRLSVYSKALDVCEVEDWGSHFQTLCEMLPNHTAKVVECFFKLTGWIKKDNFYIQTEEAKVILKAGRESSDEDVRHMAKRALDNLLKSGRFVLPELVD